MANYRITLKATDQWPTIDIPIPGLERRKIHLRYAGSTEFVEGQVLVMVRGYAGVGEGSFQFEVTLEESIKMGLWPKDAVQLVDSPHKSC